MLIKTVTATTITITIALFFSQCLTLTTQSPFQGIAINSDGSLQIAITSSEIYYYTPNSYWKKSSETTGLTGQTGVRITKEGSTMIIAGKSGWKFYTDCSYSSSSLTIGTPSFTGIDGIDTVAMSSSDTDTNVVLGTKSKGIWVLWSGAAQFKRVTRTGIGIGPLMGQIGGSATSLTALFSYPFSLLQMYQCTDGQNFLSFPSRGVDEWKSGGGGGSSNNNNKDVTITSMVTDDTGSIIGITSDAGVLISRDLGLTWTTPSSPSAYPAVFETCSQGMAMTPSGTVIAVMVGNRIFYSSNSGNTFSFLFQVNKSPTAIAVSADGSSVTVVGDLYIFQGLGCSSSGCASVNNLSTAQRSYEH